MRPGFIILLTWIGLATAASASDLALHPDLQASYKADDLDLIVKATSAMALMEACPGRVTLAEKYAPSLTLILADNDDQYGAGQSASDIAKKVNEHKTEGDCASLTRALRQGLYINVFVVPAR
jgi:hypothetical protein